MGGAFLSSSTAERPRMMLDLHRYGGRYTTISIYPCKEVRRNEDLFMSLAVTPLLALWELVRRGCLVYC